MSAKTKLYFDGIEYMPRPADQKEYERLLIALMRAEVRMMTEGVTADVHRFRSEDWTWGRAYVGDLSKANNIEFSFGGDNDFPNDGRGAFAVIYLEPADKGQGNPKDQTAIPADKFEGMKGKPLTKNEGAALAAIPDDKRGKWLSAYELIPIRFSRPEYICHCLFHKGSGLECRAIGKPGFPEFEFRLPKKAQ